MFKLWLKEGGLLLPNLGRFLFAPGQATLAGILSQGDEFLFTPYSKSNEHQGACLFASIHIISCDFDAHAIDVSIWKRILVQAT